VPWFMAIKPWVRTPSAAVVTLVSKQSSGPACQVRRVRGFTRPAHFAPQAQFVASAVAAQRYGTGAQYTELRVQLQRALARSVPAFMGRLGVAGDEDSVNGQSPGSAETRIMGGEPYGPPPEVNRDDAARTGSNGVGA
jgi:hypothetical protein